MDGTGVIIASHSHASCTCEMPPDHTPTSTNSARVTKPTLLSVPQEIERSRLRHAQCHLHVADGSRNGFAIKSSITPCCASEDSAVALFRVGESLSLIDGIRGLDRHSRQEVRAGARLIYPKSGSDGGWE